MQSALLEVLQRCLLCTFVCPTHAYFKIVMEKKQLFENAVSVIGGPTTMLNMSLPLSASYRTINHSAHFNIVIAKKTLFENSVSIIGGTPMNLIAFTTSFKNNVLEVIHLKAWNYVCTSWTTHNWELARNFSTGSVLLRST